MSEGPKPHRMMAQPGGIDVSGSDAMFRRSDPIRLATVERVLAGFAVVGTFGVFVIELGRTVLGWPG